jgi:hypothetical protein
MDQWMPNLHIFVVQFFYLLFQSVFLIKCERKRSHERSRYRLEGNIIRIKVCSDYSSIWTDPSVVWGDVYSSLISESMSLLIQFVPTVADSVPTFTVLHCITANVLHNFSNIRFCVLCFKVHFLSCINN